MPGGEARPSYNWIIQFHGTTGIAIGKCRAALAGFKKPDGQWEKFWVRTPLRREVQVYIPPDKNKRRQQTEILSKKMFQIFERKLGNTKGELHLLKPEGVVAVDWEPAMKVAPRPDGSFDLHWNDPYIAQLELVKSEIIDEMEHRPSGGAIAARLGSVPWSL